MNRWAPVGQRDADTIYALSSGLGRAGVAVFRVSGPRSRFALETLTGRSPRDRPRLCAVRSADGMLIDHALVLSFQAPASFTGEDVVEFQTHGGRAVIAAMLRALSSIEGCRLAEAGEFTRRALNNGKIDLDGAEALVDLIDAETEQQRRLALAGREALKGELADLRGSLLDAMALLEAEIDFSDEGDVTETANPVLPLLNGSRDRICSLLDASRRAERVRNGIRVVIAGEVNAGKSTLLNTLARRDVAIVAVTPGTTRDRIEVQLDLGGWPVTLIDTAGLRETEDAVEARGDRAEH